MRIDMNDSKNKETTVYGGVDVLLSEIGELINDENSPSMAGCLYTELEDGPLNMTIAVSHSRDAFIKD